MHFCISLNALRKRMSQSEPLFTIITVCRNAAESLWLTASSVLEQNIPEHFSVEYIIVDGASSDSTPQVLKRIEEACRQKVLLRIVSEPDNGIYDAMNKGTRMASGQLLCFLNAGDIFAQIDVLTRVAEVQRSKHADVYYGSVIKKLDFGLVETKPRPLEMLQRKMAFCHQSAFIRRETLIDHPYNLDYRLTADYEFFYYCYRSGKEMYDMGFPVVVFESEKGASSRNRLLMNREYARINGRYSSFSWWLEYIGKCLEVGFNNVWRALSPTALVDKIRKKIYERKTSSRS